jgi:hypothetical protein
LTFQDFRHFMGWQDERVYGRQSAHEVYRDWVIYTFRKAHGDLPTGGGLF